MIAADRLLPTDGRQTKAASRIRQTLGNNILMYLAMTVHNIPEGLAVGFAFGAASTTGDPTAYVSALGLAIGIGLQNFPEGAAVSLPMHSSLGSKHKAFACGAFSGIVEPVFAVVGFFLASALTIAQPWLLALSAGAMVFVVVEDLIPEAHFGDHPHLGTWGIMIGFAVMMVLDVALAF